MFAIFLKNLLLMFLSKGC